ncbi:hypothetical protein OPV22_010748 [Ensete ventricosum]|uniref:Uncharacterized protein n=1 Tax=Ensete ventricosum TaxID=4639 RepID=A0AAV8RI33_ENSVE|nr:hypothetical protein OPV22_010748 [Ensete ventricosum]
MIDGGDDLDGGRARGGFHRNEAISASSMGRTTTTTLSTATSTSATGTTRPSTVAPRRGIFRPGTNGGEKTNHRSRASRCLPWRFSSRWQRRRRWSRSRGSSRIRDSEKASSRCSERDRWRRHLRCRIRWGRVQLGLAWVRLPVALVRSRAIMGTLASQTSVCRGKEVALGTRASRSREVVTAKLWLQVTLMAERTEGGMVKPEE